ASQRRSRRERDRTATLAGRVQGLLSLWQEARVRKQPLALDGRDQAAVQPEPPARPPARQRREEARLRLHPLPQGQQGAEGRLAPPATFAKGPVPVAVPARADRLLGTCPGDSPLDMSVSARHLPVSRANTV